MQRVSDWLTRRRYRFDPGKDASPQAMFHRYGRLASAQGFDTLAVSISFDCDTPEDIAAAEAVHQWLSVRKMVGTFAVPGAILEQGADLFARLAGNGATFVNHGALPHAEWRDGRYHSRTFYAQMEPLAVAQDIRAGHEMVSRITGQPPIGFRAPHFGCMKTAEQRLPMYSALEELGYRFSSSTLPEEALKHGVGYRVGTIWELPLSGSVEAPLTLLDSWTYVESPFKPVVTDRFTELFTATLDALTQASVCGVFNIYVDPKHVAEGNAFQRCLDHIDRLGLKTVSLDNLAAHLDQRSSRA